MLASVLFEDQHVEDYAPQSTTLDGEAAGIEDYSEYVLSDPEAEESAHAAVMLQVDDDFRRSNADRNRNRRINFVNQVLFDYSISSDPQISNMAEQSHVKCVRVGHDLLDLLSQEDVEQLLGQVESLPGCDDWATMPDSHHSNKGQAQKLQLQPSGDVQNSGRRTKGCLLLHCLFFRSALTTLVDFLLSGQRDQSCENSQSQYQCDQSHVHEHVAVQRVFRPSKMAKAIIESYYPNKLHTFAPDHSHAFVTRNLSRKEWTANPKAVEAVKAEAAGLRANETWDDSTVRLLSDLKRDARENNRTVKIADIQTLCGEKFSENFVSSRAEWCIAGIRYTMS